jgi:hypothetical protein
MSVKPVVQSQDFREFCLYVWEFYGYQGLYPMGVGFDVIRKACRQVSKREGFEGDSIDREKVRNLLEDWGYKHHLKSPARIAGMLKEIVVDQSEKDPEDRDWYAEIGRVIDVLEGVNNER